MLQYIQRIQRRRTENGASAVEYGLLVAAIAAIIVLIVFAIGKFVKQGFEDTCNWPQQRDHRQRRQPDLLNQTRLRAARGGASPSPA